MTFGILSLMILGVVCAGCTGFALGAVAQRSRALATMCKAFDAVRYTPTTRAACLSLRSRWQIAFLGGSTHESDALKEVAASLVVAQDRLDNDPGKPGGA